MLEADLPNLALIADPASLLAILWRGRRLFAACVVGSVVLAGAYLVVAQRRYQGTAKLLVMQQGTRPLGVGGDQARLAEGAEDYIPTHALILQSPLVVGRAIDRVGLENLPSLGKSGGRAQAVREAIKSLSVTRPDRLAKILQADYQARSPEEAVRFVKALVASYKTFLEDAYQKNNSEVIQLMTRARDDLGKELKDLEQAYLEFRQASPLLLADATGRPLIKRRVDDWDRAANEAMVKAVQLKTQLELGRKLSQGGVGLWSIAYAMEQVGGASGSGLRTAGLTPGPPSDYLRQLNTESQQLADRYGPRNNRVQEIQEQIASVHQQSRATRNQLERAEVDDLITSIEQSLGSLEAMRTKMAEQFDKDSTEAKKTEMALLADANLRSNLDRQRTLFNTVVDQLKQAKLTGDFSGIRCEVIEPENALPKPVRPLGSLTLALALAAGCLLGTAAALGAGLIDPRVRTLDEVRRVLQLTSLGQVPQLPEALATRLEHAGLICQGMPRSPAAEAYKVVRANIELARRGRDLRVILVTSPREHEGRTTVASNLAVCLAQAGRRVLLVDADLRHPSLHAIYSLARERGLAQVLRGAQPLGRAVQATGVAGLEVLCSGPEVPNPAELLSSTHLHDTLARAREAYDVVIVDSPPLLTVADTSILGTAADATLLVVRASQTRRVDARHATEILSGLGTPLLGAVVNGVGPEWAGGARQRDEPGTPRAGGHGEEILADPQITLTPGTFGSAPWQYRPGSDRLNGRGREA
ncbi:MAG: polysaccharide biosynthesis tyrosine autokinase [Isosphaeraceae bacterium]|nr:polysaccharide biosynthesis tyrosine autokinase [Isosphaeraceae bacterium]